MKKLKIRIVKLSEDRFDVEIINEFKRIESPGDWFFVKSFNTFDEAKSYIETWEENHIATAIYLGEIEKWEYEINTLDDLECRKLAEGQKVK